MTVTVAGPLNMDLNVVVPIQPRPSAEIAGHDFMYSPGGKALNQAVAAARNGSRVALIGWLGSDTYGRRLLEFIKQESIDSTFVRLEAGYETPLSIVLVDPTGENRIVYDAGARQGHFARNVNFSRSDIFVCQLGLPSGSRINLLEAARRDGALTIVNAAPAPENIHLRPKDVDIIVVNKRELQQLSQASVGAAVEDCVKVTESMRAIATIVTLGIKGALLYQGGSLTRIPTLRVRAVDTAGAGDAFVGALAAQLSFGSDLPHATQYATKYAAIAVTRRGAAVSMPSAVDIDKGN